MASGPIYIAGLERSGTSLIFALLGSHPNIAMTRRTNLWTHFYNQYGDLSQPQNFERCLSMMMRYKRLEPLRPDPERIAREYWQGEPTYGRLFALVEEHYAERMGKSRWGDKSLNTERYAVPIFASYPDARIIHMIRDPRDRYSSAVTRWKVSRGGVGAGIAMWLSSVNYAERNQKRYPQKYKIVRYEDVVNQPETSLREICNFIGEDYSHEMLMMKEAESFRDEGGNSSYGQREPGVISAKSIGKYQQVLSRRQIAFMQLLARHKMMALAYPLEIIHLSPGEKLLFGSVDLPLNLTRLGTWLLREAYFNKKGRVLPSYRIITKDGSNKIPAHSIHQDPPPESIV
jgi:hypothetical protein